MKEIDIIKKLSVDKRRYM